MQYTNYNKSLSAYVTAEKKQHPTYGGKSISTSTYTSYVDPSKDTTNNFQFLTLDTYREVDPTAYNNLLNSKLRSNSVLRNKGNVLIAAAKQYNIDPVYLLCQTILETGYGTSILSQGKAITTVVSGSSVVRDSSGNVTGFKTVNGKYITSTISKKMVYNLYGIKAYDSNPSAFADSAMHIIKAGQVSMQQFMVPLGMCFKTISIIRLIIKIHFINSVTTQISIIYGTNTQQIHPMQNRSLRSCIVSSVMFIDQMCHLHMINHTSIRFLIL